MYVCDWVYQESSFAHCIAIEQYRKGALAT